MNISRWWTTYRSPLLFCVAGGLALLIDIGVLYASKAFMSLYVARALSFLCAATFTWLFNRHLTFQGPHSRSALREYASYLASMALGACINYLTFVACVHLSTTVRAQPALGVAAGSAAGLIFNYYAARRIMSKDRAS